MLERGHVAATPGIGFGANGERFLRFSYTTDAANIADTMNRVERFLKVRNSKGLNQSR